MMKKLIFDTAKEAFRRGYRKYKRGQRKTERVPYDLVKKDIKKSIRGTKFTTQAEIKATPGAKRRIILRIERAKRSKEKFRTPVIYGKAYASDKKGKTMQVSPLTRKQRRDMRKEMAAAADRGYKKVRLRKLGYLKGGLLTEGIKFAYKQYRKAGGRSITEIMKSGVRGSGKRSDAKADVKFGIRLHGGKKLTTRDKNKLK